MARYIDSELIQYEVVEVDHGYGYTAGQGVFRKDIEAIPTADAVPVVRCKDCRWWDKSEGSPFGYCMAMKHGYMSANWEIGIYRRYKGDFYCADAERRTDE